MTPIVAKSINTMLHSYMAKPIHTPPPLFTQNTYSKTTCSQDKNQIFI